MRFKTYEEAVLWLEEVPLYGHKDGLNNMFRLMECLGNPQEHLKVIHVAGTNGKGSCCAMLQRILMEAGFTVGLYTSPHLMDYCERIRIGDTLIAQEDFLRLLVKVKDANDQLVEAGFPHATFFEFLTAMAYLYFSEQAVDYVVLETGVGGRLDSTNIIQKPVACLITSISFDHVKTLGDTLPLIAGEKAGIIKPGCPVIAAKNPEEVLEVFRKKAEELTSPYYETQEGRFQEGGYVLSLEGDYQKENAEAVLEVVSVLRMQGVAIPEEAVYNGLKETIWPGRMQKITWNGASFILEGAHNPDAAAILGRWIASQPNSLQLVFGALRKKDALGVLQGIALGQEKISKILFTPIAGADSLQEADMQDLVDRLQLTIPWEACPDAGTALADAVQCPGTVTVVAGSLYLIGEVLTCFHFQKN